MSRRILIVENDSTSREIFSNFFRKKGYEVNEARDGADAIELMHKSRFDLVLSDFRMPRLDGVALAKYILPRHQPFLSL